MTRCKLLNKRIWKFCMYIFLCLQAANCQKFTRDKKSCDESDEDINIDGDNNTEDDDADNKSKSVLIQKIKSLEKEVTELKQEVKVYKCKQFKGKNNFYIIIFVAFYARIVVATDNTEKF